ncbi:gliding motility lipoprotein GldB [Hufsiella ginkgonis]|uniref:Gliding motility lipoprotein GldB n=1 Tax=Hufsiella ginkgonis TaxID=2695274 RepID=A0A7K1Y2Y3_9SPHI|nr:gliding motility lipoprotein GldB [Hufsiella ginkgonis]MXV17601.1 gliding motility lipoprotein GldB [Hufsiella ginkgonis]
MFFSRKQIYLFFFISFLLSGCGDRKRIDVSHIDLSVKIERFDVVMGNLSPATLAAAAPSIKARYGDFYDDLVTKMLGAGSTADTGYYQTLRQVLTSKDFFALKEEVARIYPDLSSREAELTDAFKHIRYYYPAQKIPRLISFFSGFYTQTVVGNDYLGIGLDMFLGANSKFYPALRQSIPAYMSRRYTPENITPRVMETFIREDLFPERTEDQTLLARMVYNGKILYLMDAVMPDVQDSLKISYTASQVNWAKENESNIWAYFIDSELLYESDYMKIQKYLTDAPFTPGIGEHNESAPKLAVWTGWQIIKKYMEKNPGVTIQELMKDPDYQSIMRRSKYKP